MAPTLNNNNFENLSLVLMFQGKESTLLINARLRFSNILLFKWGAIYATGLLNFKNNL